MDPISYVTTAAELIKKHRLLLLMIAAGVILLTLPAEEKTPQPEPVQAAVTEESQSLEERLSGLLSKMEGAGKTAVLLTQARGEQLLYQTDESASGSDLRTETVLVTNAGREETGLLRQKLAPVYQGAVILCQGADRPEVRLRIVEAVMSATGLTSDKITVLKMK